MIKYNVIGRCFRSKITSVGIRGICIISMTDSRIAPDNVMGPDRHHVTGQIAPAECDPPTRRRLSCYGKVGICYVYGIGRQLDNT